jgi:hypothetical protein
MLFDSRCLGRGFPWWGDTGTSGPALIRRLKIGCNAMKHASACSAESPLPVNNWGPMPTALPTT